MSIDANEETKKTRASFVGTLPGPRTGMTLSTAQIVDRLEKVCDLRKFDMGRWYKARNLAWRIKKLLFSVVAAFAILFWRKRPGERLYITLNSTTGLLYNVLQVFTGRIRGFQCVLHHHVYHYIENVDWRMTLLLKCAGTKSVHVMACRQMADDFNAAYQCQVKSLIVPPAVVPVKKHRQSSADKRFIVGHLSNLSVAKGLHEVLKTFELLLESHDEIETVLAGPCHDTADQSAIDELAIRFPNRFRYIDAVYSEQKIAFFESLYAFVFPTKIESWGIVLNEALAAGVPVVSVKLACIPCLVENAGELLDPQDEFSLYASQTISNWASNPSLFAEKQRAATNRGFELEKEIDEAMDDLVQFISGKSDFGQ